MSYVSSRILPVFFQQIIERESRLGRSACRPVLAMLFAIKIDGQEPRKTTSSKWWSYEEPGCRHMAERSIATGQQDDLHPLCSLAQYLDHHIKPSVV